MITGKPILTYLKKQKELGWIEYFAYLKKKSDFNVFWKLNAHILWCLVLQDHNVVGFLGRLRRTKNRRNFQPGFRILFLLKIQNNASIDGHWSLFQRHHFKWPAYLSGVNNKCNVAIEVCCKSSKSIDDFVLFGESRRTIIVFCYRVC
jgi:hypothetical protein